MTTGPVTFVPVSEESGGGQELSRPFGTPSARYLAQSEEEVTAELTIWALGKVLRS